MKILEVVHFFSPLHGGGVINVLYDLSKQLSKRGHEVTIYTSDFELDQEFIKSLENVNVRVFHSISLAANIYVTLGMITRLKKEIKSFDFINIHCYRSFQSIIAYHYAKKYAIPYIIQAHGGIPRFKEKGRLSWIYDILFGNRLLRDASKVIALNQMEVQHYDMMGVPNEKIVVIPNGIDLSEYANLPHRGLFRKKFGLDANEKIVLYLARIHQIKGIDVLVKAFANLVDKLDNVKLVIVGPDDGYLSEVEVLIESLNISDNVLISGPLYGQDKLEAYVDADVYVLPSKYETFPMSVLEAYACNKPVVASNFGGLDGIIINGVTGLLFELGNEKKLAESVISLLRDNTTAKEMGLKGKQFVKENFAINNVIDDLETLYDTIRCKMLKNEED